MKLLQIFYTLIFTLFLFSTFASYAQATLTFVVDSTRDSGDASLGDGVCADSSGECTLRAAIEESNAITGQDLIHFDITGSGPHVIPLNSNLPRILESLTIDGTTQPGYSGSPLIMLDGQHDTSVISGLQIHNTNTTVKGLSIVGVSGSGIAVYGQGHVIEGNYLGVEPDGVTTDGNSFSGISVHGGTESIRIGGTSPAERNVIAGNFYGINVNRARNVAILGNYIGLDSMGTTALGNTGPGIQVFESSEIEIGGGDGGNYVASNHQGILVNSSSEVGIYYNIIGTDTSLTLAANNFQYGIVVGNGSSNVTIGNAEGGGNVIVNSLVSGIRLDGRSHSNVVKGNFIGWHPDTGPMGNLESGILIRNSSNNQIGGVELFSPIVGAEWCSGACNVIAYSKFGVEILEFDEERPADGNSVRKNSLFENTLGGIKLKDAINDDYLDTDSGANMGQNVPRLGISAYTDGFGKLLVHGSLHSMPSTPFLLDFYLVDFDIFCQYPERPQAKIPIGPGRISTFTNSSGDISWLVSLRDVPYTGNEMVVATATDPEGNTSEISFCTPIFVDQARIETSLILDEIKALVAKQQITPKIAKRLNKSLKVMAKNLSKSLNKFVRKVNRLLEKQKLDIETADILIKHANYALSLVQ